MGQQMRIMIVSDTHGKHVNLDRAVKESGKIDVMIHLGDVEGGECYIDTVVNCEKHILGGNNDFFSKLPSEEIIYLGNKKVFITHGHRYLVSLGTEEVKRAGRTHGADIVMFGHTHCPHMESDEGMLVLNPGSLSYPRQEGREASYMIMEIDEEGKVSCEQRYLKK